MSTHRATKWLKKARRISKLMEDFKERDVDNWTQAYNELDLPSTARPTLRQFLKTKSSRVTRDQYRAMAVARMAEIEAEERRNANAAAQRSRERQSQQNWSNPEWRAELENDLRLEYAEIYNQDVERRLREEELSIRDIERVDLRERARRYGQRRYLARQMLAEADAHRAAAHRAAAAPASPPTTRTPARDPHPYYSDDELGGHVRKQKHKRTHKNKKIRSRKKTGKVKKTEKVKKSGKGKKAGKGKNIIKHKNIIKN